MNLEIKPGSRQHRKPYNPQRKHKKSSPERVKNINIFRATEKLCTQLYNSRNTTLPIVYDIRNLESSETILENLTVYEREVSVEDIDTLDASINLVSCGLNPLVLNMASKYKAGGGVRNGATAQEEVIFRRTNACVVYPRSNTYPLDDYEIIYSPEIQILFDRSYKILNNFVSISMIGVHALKNPKLIRGELHDDDYELMYEKIESIFKLALINGHDSLVLGALGCGAYKNPPEDISEIYFDLLEIYGKYFKKIIFAILVCKDTDMHNYNTFLQKLRS